MVGKTYFYQAGSYGGRMEILRKPPCAKIYGGSNHARHPFGEHRVSVYAKQNMEKYSITDSVIKTDAKGLEITHFSVKARNELTIDDL